MIINLLLKQASSSMNDFFLFILPSFGSSSKSNENTDNNIISNDENLTCLLYIYFFYFKRFVSLIQSIHPPKYKDIIFKIEEITQYEFHENNTLLMRYGDKGDKFYFIL